MILALCGFMGCGKSTIGRNLSAYVYSNYIDLDLYIRQKHGMLEKDLFELYGEDVFREYESEALKEIFEKYSNSEKDLILSLGGGTLTYNKSANIIKQFSHCVYLKTNKTTLYKRLSKNNSNRPMLQGKQGKNLMEKIDLLIEEREPIYNKIAQTIIDCNNKSIFEITNEISKLF